MTTNTASTVATATAAARKRMLSFWKAEIKFAAGRAAVRTWAVTGPFRRQIKELKKMAAREERRAQRA